MALRRYRVSGHCVPSGVFDNPEDHIDELSNRMGRIGSIHELERMLVAATEKQVAAQRG